MKGARDEAWPTMQLEKFILNKESEDLIGVTLRSAFPPLSKS